MKPTKLLDHAILIAGCLIMGLPVLSLILSATHPSGALTRSGLQWGWGEAGLQPFIAVLTSGDLFGNGVTAAQMLWNSLIVATGIAVLKTLVSALAAYALTYFRLPGAPLIFGAILLALFFPVETRVLSTFLVTDRLGLLNSYAGMILPIAASGLGTVLFRQFFLQIPEEIAEAARLDGAGPWRFFRDFIVPLSMPMIVALFALLFLLGWNQYLWPIMITTSSEEHYTIVRGIERFGLQGNAGLALASLALFPPVVVLLAAQRWLVRGLTGWL